MANDIRPALVYLRKNDKFDGVSKQPYLKGFISISPELLEEMVNMELDDRGQVKLEIAVWQNDEQPGVLKGNASKPYKKQQEGRPAPKSTPKRKHSADDDTDF